MPRKSLLILAVLFLFCVGSLSLSAQTITATLEGRVTDSAGAVLPDANVTAVNEETGLARSVVTSGVGEYRLGLLPVGEYTVSAEKTGFRRESKKITLLIAQTVNLDFTLQVGEVAEEVVVEAGTALLDPTRSSVSSVIIEKQIESLPVNGRQFIDFTLLAPGVQIGETTSGSTDVIVEPVTKLAFGGQNIHYNFVAIDGADNMSTASGIHKTTPSQEAVQEFQVINTQYNTEFGRSSAGIVNIVTKSGTNDLHGSAYWFFENNALNARSILASPDANTCTVPGDLSSGGCGFLDLLQQNQFGFTLGGPIAKDRAFFFVNYEGQRRAESPFYNTALSQNINTINAAKISFGLPPENLNVVRDSNTDSVLAKIDYSLSKAHLLTGRYFFNDGRYTNFSPLNDGFDAPSTFRNDLFRDQSLLVSLTSTFSPTVLNVLRGQFARRSFNYPAITTQPHLEVSNTFTTGVNRGNPDVYRESRFELVDNVTLTRGPHTISLGGNFNVVRTFESFPLFSPFEASFSSVNDYVSGNPSVIFWETFPPGTAGFYTATGVDPSFFLLNGFPEEVRQQASTEVNHYYNGLFINDKWNTTSNLTLNFGIRYEWENWPKEWIDNDLNNFDPRFGFAYRVGTKANLVLRGGVGIFHGTIPSNLLLCQEPSCGGSGPFPGRENVEDALNARTGLFAFASIPSQLQAAFNNFITTGSYPTVTLPGVDFLGQAVIVRFAQKHQAPYAIQMSFGLEFEPVKDVAVSVGYLRVKGIHLGSFFDVNQPDPNPAFTLLAHDSSGNVGLKPRFYALCFNPPECTAAVPGVLDFTTPTAVYFEADSRWRSVYDGLLVNANKRFSNHYSFGISYTWSKTIDDGPNPSFVLIPQDASHIDQERALSADHVAHRFVANSILSGPRDVNPVIDDWDFSFIFTGRSAHYFTIFAGYDANGNVFGVNDRVGIEPRNTFKGDQLWSFDTRVTRNFPMGESKNLQFIFEAFNLFNTLNVRFFNTVYGAGDFCPVGGPGFCGTGPFFAMGSPNSSFATPRAINNPRQIQFALKFTF
jgi:hypothetical protein